MVPLVQLVRASDCGSECHGFESHRAPQKRLTSQRSASFFALRTAASPQIPVVLIFCITGCSQSWLFLFPARKSALNLAHMEKDIPASFMAITGTKQVARALWRSSRGLLWGAGWRIRQLRCPALCKDLCKSEDKERYIPDTSELRSERLYFRIEWLCGRLVERLSK